MKSMKKLGNEGVSEIIGTILLLAIAVATFSVLAIYVFSSTSPSTPSPDLNLVAGINEEQHIIIEHKGGDELKLEKVRITIWKGEADSVSYSFNSNGELIGQYATFNDDGNKKWNIGEYIDINATGAFGNITRWQISAVVIDEESNSVVLSGVIKTGIVNIVPPVAIFTYAPFDPKIQEIVIFNASQSYDPDGGSIVTYKWDFNSDGTIDGYGVVVVHKYTTEGTYNVTLTVIDDEGQIGTAITGTGYDVPPPLVVSGNLPPQGDFEWYIDPSIDGTVDFISNVTDPDGEIVSYFWNFGDGRTSTSPNPSHTYEHSGNYTVTLIVTDDNGGQAVIEGNVIVPNIRPQAGFSYSPANVTTSRTIYFDGGIPYSYDKDGTIVNWSWDFDNNSIIDAYGSTASHRFTEPGNYTIVLNVTDNDGGWDTYAKTIRVYPTASASPPRFLFVDNTPIGWDSGIDNLLTACQSIMPDSEYSYGKAIDQWTFTNDQYTSEDLRGENITDTVINQFDIVIWSCGDFPGDGGNANWDGDPNTWSTSMTEGYDDTSDHVYELAEHLTGNVTAGTLLLCGTYVARDLQDYPGNGAGSSEIWLGNVVGLIEPTGGIHYDPDWVPFSGRLGEDYFRGEPYYITGTLTGIINTSSGQSGVANLTITSPIPAYTLNKQSDPIFNYSLQGSGQQTEETIFDEDMETNPGWVTGGSQNEWDWGICKGGPGYANAHSGSRCYGTDMSGSDYRYNNNAYCYVRTGWIDLNDYTTVTLEFYDWYEIESGYDYVYLQVYDDDTWTWQTIDSFTGNQESWTYKSYDLSSYAGKSIRIRWLLDSDGSVRYDGYYLDDVVLKGTTSSMPSGYFAIDAERGRNRSIILGFDLNADEITPESRTNYLRNVLLWLAEGAGYTTEVWVNNDPPEGWLDEPDHLDSIQAGIGAVPPGGTVYVIGTDGQIYEENVVVNKSVNIIGIDNPTIRVGGSYAVKITVDWARIDGFNIEGENVQNGFYLENAARCTIINCNLSGSITNNGIYLFSSHNNTIRNNNIQNAQHGIYASWSLGNKIFNNTIHSTTQEGIYLYRSSLTLIRNNTIYNADNGGIYMEALESCRVSNNTIHNNSGDGIHLVSSTNQNIIENNTLYNNSNGIHLDISNNNTLLSNTITNNTNAGIYLEDYSHSNSLRENTISFNGYGILLENASDNDMVTNTISHNQQGIRLYSSSSNIMSNNAVYNNTGNGINLIEASDFNVIYSSSIQNNYIGVYIYNSKNNTIEENTISNNSMDGIYLYRSLITFLGENRIINNNISLNDRYGIYIESSKGNIITGNTIYSNNQDGIRLSSFSDENSIINNTIWNNFYGIYIYRSNFNDIFNNTIHNNSVAGIYLNNYASENDAQRNTIEYNGNGIKIQISSINNLTNNTIRNNQEYGIMMLSSSGNIVNENQIYSNINDGIFLYSCDDIRIINNTVYENYNGVHLTLSGGTGITIENNTVYSNNRNGIYLESSKTAVAGNNEVTQNEIYSNNWSGICLVSSSINLIQQNEVYLNECGIYLNLSNTNTLQENSIHNNSLHGIYLYSSNSNDIENNNISFNGGDGIHLSSSSQGYDNPLSYNNIWNNSNAGICINSSSDNKIEYNTIWNNSYGMYIIQSSANNEIRFTIITDNSYGVYINQTSTNNLIHDNNITLNGYGTYIASSDCTSNDIYKNNFINNTLHNNSQAYDLANNSWYIGTEGNYWSDLGNQTYYTIPPYGVQDLYPLESPRQWWI
ncbi:MAG TPA: PKD domain-containing protein [Thermoplasmatales archaeon]|nr:PKD domain-containing protein [Thermoplasmatales archaeon]